MELALALIGSDGGERHLIVEVPADASVGEVAATLAVWAGRRGEGPWRMRSLDRGVTLDHGREFASARMLWGELVVVEPVNAPDRPAPVAAIVRQARHGPHDRVLLEPGRVLLGRSSECPLELADRTVARVQAELDVSADGRVTVTPISTRSPTCVDGRLIRATTPLALPARLGLGATELVVHRHGRHQVNADPDGRIVHTPLPRVMPPATETEVAWPTPPTAPRPQRIPMISSLSPLVVAFATYLMTRNPAALLFSGLSPIIAMLSYVESRRLGRRDHGELVAAWRRDADGARRQLKALERSERDRLERLHPAVPELLAWIEAGSGRVWERQRTHPDALRVRIGRSGVPVGWRITAPTSGDRDLLAEAVAEIDTHREVADAPMTIDLAAHSTVAVRISSQWDGGGPSRDNALHDVAAAVILQVATLLGPADAVVAAALHPSMIGSWDWLKWLPHAAPSEPVGPVPLAATPEDVRALCRTLTDTMTTRAAQMRTPDQAPQWPHLVVLVDCGPDPIDAGLLRLANATDPKLGITFVIVARRSKELGPTASAIISATSMDTGYVAYPGSSARLTLALEGLPVGVRDTSARLLAAHRDPRLARAESAELPSSVPLTSIVGFGLRDDPDAVARLWSGASRSLAAPIGRSADGSVTIDIRVDGPHGLVAGTTGAGKSELLQAIVASFAVRHSPGRLNFLLVDYKGGAAFKDCADLIHTVGLVTDLDAHLVSRVLTSMKAELTRREHLFAQFDARDLIEMERQHAADAPPNLLIIVDEFAALSREHPEFVEGMVDIAQRGRSLGIHMILATQRPAGVITDNIRANTNLRIALRVSDVAESTDVIASPVAAQFDRRLPGRAALRVGPADLVAFQAAYVGGTSTVAARSAEIGIRPLRIDAHIRSHPSASPEPAPQPQPDAASDLSRFVINMNAASRQLGLHSPRRPWLAPLGEVIDLERDLEISTVAGALAIGRADQPRVQAQTTAVLELATSGNVLVCGGSGAGKTVALRTIAAAASLHPHDAMRVYGIDMAGRGLGLLESLSSVGSIIDGGDVERVSRLLRNLRQTVDTRQDLLGEHRAADLAELRRRSPAHRDIPRIVVLIDGLHALLDEYERVEGGVWIDTLAKLLADGRAVGVHFVVAGDRRSGIPSRFTSQLPAALVLRQASTDEYLAAGLPAGALGDAPPPGRGYLGGLEVQVATLDGACTGDDQATAYERLAARERERGVEPAPAIGRLPTEVWLDQLAPGSIGVAATDLSPVALPADGPIMGVFGPPRSGRTSALLTIGESLVAGDQARPCLFLAPRPLAEPAPPWVTHGTSTADEIAQVLRELVPLLRERAGWRPIVLIDDITDIADPAFDDALQELLNIAAMASFNLVVAGDASAMRQSYSGPGSLLRRSKRGLLLMPEMEDGDVFNTALAKPSVPWVPGRGYLVVRSATTLVQLAQPSRHPTTATIDPDEEGSPTCPSTALTSSN